ncbi:MAG: methylated-DNA--[protein]-cysteine S-methyltransferase [Saprospiraceae bacterium]|nr:methylated-DNA--[protein]-cysteine S-methyltransferase [Saprospiraceae bacterium]
MNYGISVLSPIGRLYLEASEQGLSSISMAKGFMEERPGGCLQEAKSQLLAYFAGSRKSFELPLDFDGATAYCTQVWQELLHIPFGTTISYLKLAKRVGGSTHTRAVGLANGKNPIPIVVPCHRVIGSDGSLTGYALGLDVKLFLLNHEQPGAFGIQASLF